MAARVAYAPPVVRAEKNLRAHVNAPESMATDQGRVLWRARRWAMQTMTVRGRPGCGRYLAQRLWATVAAFALIALAAACSGAGESPEQLTRASGAPGSGGADPAVTAGEGVPPHTFVLEATTSIVPRWSGTSTTALPVVQPAPAGLCRDDAAPRIRPGDDSTGLDTAVATLATAVNDPGFRGSSVSVSVWIEGWGPVADKNTALMSPPASNQKLLTAAGAYERLDIDEHTRTPVVATGPVIDGVLRGDVVLVGGGDPSVTRSGVRSLDSLAFQIKERGIDHVEGRVLVDEDRYDAERSIASWPAGWASIVGGPMSALMVDRNRGLEAADPALTNGELFKASLGAAGIQVDGDVERGSGELGEQIAVLEGPTYGELITTMLTMSDNLVAEMLVKEIGRRHLGEGSTQAGLAAIRDAVAVLCVPPGGSDVDGSGLSSANAHSTEQFRRLLQVASKRSWGSRFMGSLPVAGQSGTLAGRLIGPFTTGNVRAKTGSIAVSKALSGYVMTAGGRQGYFSIIVNGNATGGLEPVIDNIPAQIAALPN